MKARIKSGPNANRTIEVTKVNDWSYQNTRSGKVYQSEELDFSENTCDWEVFRRETAKNMLPITAQMKIAKGSTVLGTISTEHAAKLAIEYADELIKQLKRK